MGLVLMIVDVAGIAGVAWRAIEFNYFAARLPSAMAVHRCMKRLGCIPMTDKNSKIESSLSGLDDSKRQTLSRLLTGTAFVAPIVASFAMDSLSISTAVAAVNGTGSGLAPA
jgi:hypothetical protein